MFLDEKPRTSCIKTSHIPNKSANYLFFLSANQWKLQIHDANCEELYTFGGTFTINAQKNEKKIELVFFKTVYFTQ